MAFKEPLGSTEWILCITKICTMYPKIGIWPINTIGQAHFSLNSPSLLFLSNFFKLILEKRGTFFQGLYVCLLCSKAWGITGKCINLLSGLSEVYSIWLRPGRLSLSTEQSIKDLRRWMENEKCLHRKRIQPSSPSIRLWGTLIWQIQYLNWESIQLLSVTRGNSSKRVNNCWQLFFLTSSFIAETGVEPEHSQSERKGRQADLEKSLLNVKRGSFHGF